MKAIDILFDRLSRLVDDQRYETALDIYRRSSSAHLTEITSPRSSSLALLLLGAKICLYNQIYDETWKQLDILERQCEDIESNVDFVIVKFQLLNSTGHTSEAFELINRAVSRSWPEKDYYKLNFHFGMSHFWKGDYLEANHCFQQCYRYYVSSTDQYMLGCISHMLGYIAFQRSFFDIAESFCQRALQHFGTVEKNIQIGDTYHLLGIFAYRTGRFGDAFKNFQAARLHYEKRNSKLRVINSDIASARISIYLEEYDDAERLLLTSCRQSNDIGYKRGTALSAEFLGEIHYYRANYTESLRYLEIAEELASEIAPSGDIAVEAHRRLGDLFIAREELERAEEHLSRALEIGEHLNDRYELGSIYRAYGLLFARKGNLDRARSFFMESIVTLQVIHDRYELARTYLTAADTYRQWCLANSLSDEYKTELLRDSDTYEVEAMHLYQSLGLDHKVKEVEERRKGKETALVKKDARFIQIPMSESWLCHGSIVARSSHMRSVMRKAENLAPGIIPVFITGETGTGKEIIARLLHELSERSSGPLIAVNCASIADTVFESELFGHKRGAFTGAISDKVGLVEMASGGTLFLDEISELTDRQQAKLLRTLEESSIRRVGEIKERPVDVRIVSASNKGIGELLSTGKLRTDFFFRISAERVELAPLRERREDIVPLFAFYLHSLCGPCEIEGDIPELLEHYHWPGNIRELINIVKALAQLRRSNGAIRTSDLPLRIRDYDSSELKTGREHFIDRLEMRKLLFTSSCREHPDQIRELILSSLERCNGNYSAAARELGIARTTLYRRMQELELL